jgi:arginine/lysine/ornithine decarboxylase
LTYKATLRQSECDDKLSDSRTLADAIEQHCVKEKASFHTPGHKGGTNFRCGQNLWALDVTELPGLDELSYASGVLADVQLNAANLWGSQQSFISTNGASAALMAAILACAPRGKKILLPINVHRSAINALVLCGLQPVWYAPSWNEAWETWDAVQTHTFNAALAEHGNSLAAAVVTSPAYSGAVSDIKALSQACHAAQVPLIADEAHGAHFFSIHGLPPHAVAQGADLVAHSLHKTLSAMTQTGIIHVGHESLVDADAVRLALNMLQSSSPNYVLMTSIESALNEVRSGHYINRAVELCSDARAQLNSLAHINIYAAPTQDPLHLLLSVNSMSAEDLIETLGERGIYAEAVLGRGVLLLFGCGTTKTDVQLLAAVLKDLDAGTNAELPMSHSTSSNSSSVQHQGVNGNRSLQSISNDNQVLSPKEAFFGRTETIPLADAVGRIAAECVAPCPPGNPVVVPGQRVTAAALDFCKLPVLRVVVESQQGEQ